MDNIRMRESFFHNIRNKKLVVFGTGGLSVKICGFLKYDIEYYIDNDSEKNGKIYRGKFIRNVSAALEDMDSIIVLIASMYYDDMVKQLVKLGFVENENVFDSRKVFYYELKEGNKLGFETAYMSPSEHLSLAFTFNCSAKCPHCLFVQQNYEFEQNKFITSEFVTSILESDKAQKINKVTCGGGEALLHPNFFSLIKLIKSHGIPFVETFTNGLVLQSDSLVKSLIEQKELSHIHISLDAINEEDYNKARGLKKSDFSKIVHNIKKIACGLKGSNTRVGVSFVIGEEKYPFIKEMIEFSSGLNIDYCHFTALHVMDNSMKVAYSKGQIPIYDILRELVNGHEPYGFDIFIQPPLEEGNSRYYCDSLAEHLCISPEGTMAPCCHIPWHIKYGSFFGPGDNPINNNVSVEMRQKFIQAYGAKNEGLLPEQCKSCNRRLISRYSLKKGTTCWKFV